MESDQFFSALQQAMDRTNNSLAKYGKLLQSAKDKDMQTIIKNMAEKKQAQLEALKQIKETAQGGKDISSLVSAGSLGNLSGRSEFNKSFNQLIQSGINTPRTNPVNNSSDTGHMNTAKTKSCRSCKHYNYCKAKNRLID
ncbi:MAG TPA: hypothetical protein PKW50_03380 [Syntrophomonas sp.]|nr:hypothetical protein [Syntrophomonas sp.]HPT69162.1 hypothetical protein [Syntrophomonas sp.]